MWAKTTGQQKRSHFSKERESPCRLAELHEVMLKSICKQFCLSIYSFKLPAFKGEGLSLTEAGSFLRKEHFLSSVSRTLWMQICCRPHELGEYSDSAHVPSAPRPLTPAQALGIHCLTRQRCFQRHLMELLPALPTPTPPTKHCQGISRLCSGHQKNDLWWEISEGKEYGEKLKEKKKLGFKPLLFHPLWTHFVSVGHQL